VEIAGMTTAKQIEQALEAVQGQLTEMATAAYSNMQRRQVETAAEIVTIARAAVREALAPALKGSPAFERWSRPGVFDAAARAAEAVAALVTPPG